ncbi:MAG: DUF2510 domain-containing protein [Candidatus Nanopelagicales bacterium]|nr:DUF2510 domain-containing protein [Candidatus Nanopelagicales bacterium]
MAIYSSVHDAEARMDDKFKRTLARAKPLIPANHAEKIITGFMDTAKGDNVWFVAAFCPDVIVVANTSLVILGEAHVIRRRRPHPYQLVPFKAGLLALMLKEDNIGFLINEKDEEVVRELMNGGVEAEAGEDLSFSAVGGWFDDPDSPATQLRFHDGNAWTSKTATKNA